MDEGPGLSGSTLLGVADGIELAGVRADRIAILCSRRADPDRLFATNAAARWRSRAPHVVSAHVHPPAVVERDVSGGAWRELFWAREDDWPAVFASAERRKLLASDRLYKYEGLGSAAALARERARVLADAALSPDLRDEGDGWASYRWRGRPLPWGERSDEILERLASYCALRATFFPAHIVEPLEPMVEKNIAVVLGRAVRVPPLPVVLPMVVDGRMHPHEWIRASGALLKTDAIAHGDDHFFPGPTDVAWDLAGTIVEWGLDDAASEKFLHAYALASSDDPTSRIAAWTCAYAAFRAALTLLALEDARGTPEERRLERDLGRYRDLVGRLSEPWLVTSAPISRSTPFRGA